MNQRQGERRLFFQHLFAQMPLWETWDVSPRGITYLLDGMLPPKPRKDFRAIPRRLRRQMARARAKREWGAGKETANV